MRHIRLICLLAALLLVLAACDGDAADQATAEPAPAPAAPDEADEPEEAQEAEGGEGAEDGGEAAGEDPGDGDGEPAPAGPVEVEVSDVVTGLEAPWAVAIAGERVFVTERDTGRLLELVDDVTQEVRSFTVDNAGEGGLLGLAVDPDDEARLFAYLTTGSDNRVVTFSPDDGSDPEVVLDGIPKGNVHNGGRIAFGPDGMLYVATGDAAQPDLSQDERSLAGKILRVTAEGGVPDDNPIDGSPVYALGLRNPQGLAWTDDGDLFASEFGPDVDDEINRIEPGGNYGWPEVTGEAGEDRFVDPVLVRQPAEASWSGLAHLSGSAIPQWDGSLFAPSLRGNRLWRVELGAGGEVAHAEELLAGEHGRLRQAVQAPDGSLWVLTNNTDGRGSPRDGDDRILRLGPPG